MLQRDRSRRVNRNDRAVYQRRDRLRVTCVEALWLVGLEQRCGDDLVAHDPFALAPAPYPLAQVFRDVVGRVDELAQELLLPVDRDVQPASTAPLERSRRLAWLGAFERDVGEVDVDVPGVENEGCNETVPSKCYSYSNHNDGNARFKKPQQRDPASENVFPSRGVVADASESYEFSKAVSAQCDAGTYANSSLAV